MTTKRSHSITIIPVVLLLLIGGGVLIYSIWWSNQPRPGHVKDEALLAGRDATSFPAADEDYFHDMDGGIDLTDGAPENDKLALVKGRNTWVVWTAGNDRLWNTLIYRSAGALDFLKVLSTHPDSFRLRGGINRYIAAGTARAKPISAPKM